MEVRIHFLKIIFQDSFRVVIQNMINWASRGSAFLVIILLIAGCNFSDKTDHSDTAKVSVSPIPNDEYFQEIGEDIGLNFVHSIGASEMENIIESVGGGAAFIDYDQDGFMDVYICSGSWLEGFSKTKPKATNPHNHLYRNLQNGTFKEVSKEAGVDGPWYSMGITVGDINNDGYPDIYLSNYGKNTLYLNNGDGTFKDITDKAGAGGGEQCSVGAVWLDYDNDGLLDLYVGNYLNYDPDYSYYYAPDGFPGPLAYDSQKDILFKKKQWENEVVAAMPLTDERPLLIGDPLFINDVLPASEANARGNIVRSSIHPNDSYYKQWRSTEDSILWNIEVLEKGEFEIEFYYACSEKNIGTKIELSFQNSSVTKPIIVANDMPLIGVQNDRVKRDESFLKDFKPLNLGRIMLPKGKGIMGAKATVLNAADDLEFYMIRLKRIN